MKKSTVADKGTNGKECDYCEDFRILPVEVKRGIVKTAENLLKQQQENNALLAAASRVAKKKGFA